MGDSVALAAGSGNPGNWAFADLTKNLTCSGLIVD
jgi:hypothetical protein